MEPAVMGKVLVAAKLENVFDLYNASQGLTPGSPVRAIEVPDALVDTGASYLSLPTQYIAQLGLVRLRTQRVLTSGGQGEAGIYSAVRLTVQDRQCTMDVCEVPDGCPVLIGQLPLETLDFVVDPKRQRLIGNPEHGGEHLVEIY